MSAPHSYTAKELEEAVEIGKACLDNPKRFVMLTTREALLMCKVLAGNPANDAQDAARYRYLRDSENAFPLCFIAQRTSSPRNVVVQFSGATADSMVDAMMKLRTDATPMPSKEQA